MTCRLQRNPLYIFESVARSRSL